MYHLSHRRWNSIQQQLQGRGRLLCIVFCMALLSGCSIRQIAINSLGNALAEGSSVYATDNDIELVGAAIPFGLKTLEGLIAAAPENQNLLLAAASGFTQYSYVYVQVPALELAESDPALAREQRLRAKNLYLRARGYGLRTLEVAQPGFERTLYKNPAAALAPFRKQHVPALYWTLLAWTAAISVDKQDMEMVADLHLIEPLIQRCLELDPDYKEGALHEFMISFDGARSGAQGGSSTRARLHFQRAIELSGGHRMAPLVALADSVAVREQNPVEFQALLEQVLAFDTNQVPRHRLANTVAQQRARSLLARRDALFLED